MIKSLKMWSPKKVFLVHGDKPVMPIFKKKIESALGIETTILQMNKKIEFD
jgi:predicted metal-dependent RNase